MSTITATRRTQVSDIDFDHDSRAAARSSHALFVIPRERGDGFQVSIRGHILDLADPSSGHELAPTPDDLFIVSIAS